MCIIVAKPANIAMPSVEILANCFDRNPDGAGFMFNHKGKVYGFKGLMTFEEFMDKLDYAEKKYGSFKEKGAVFHFRIGTHGTNIPANTHPFPITSKYKEMRQTAWVAQQGIAHNGVLYNFSYHADVKNEDVSDTMVFTKYCVAPLAQYTDLATDSKIRDILNYISGTSRLAFMDGSGTIATCGTFERDGGILYSNDGYKTRRPKFQTCSAEFLDGINGIAYGWDEKGYYEIWPSSQKKTYINLKCSSATKPTLAPAPYTPPKKPYGDDDWVMEFAADEDGLVMLPHSVTMYAPGEDFDGQPVAAGHAYNPNTGTVYYWNAKDLAWDAAYSSQSMCLFDDEDCRYLYISPKILNKEESGDLYLTAFGVKTSASANDWRDEQLAS